MPSVYQLPLPLDGQRCRVCDLFLPLDCFRLIPASGNHRRACKACDGHRGSPDAERERSARYRNRHRERYRENQRAWSKAHPGGRAAHLRTWRKRHWDKAYSRIVQDRAKNPDRYRGYAHKRRLRKRDAGTWTPEEWQAVKARYAFTCLMCGKREPVIALTFDHIVPLSRGGSNTIDNCQPLCGRCNSSKGQRSLDLRPQ